MFWRVQNAGAAWKWTDVRALYEGCRVERAPNPLAAKVIYRREIKNKAPSP